MKGWLIGGGLAGSALYDQKLNKKRKMSNYHDFDTSDYAMFSVGEILRQQSSDVAIFRRTRRRPSATSQERRTRRRPSATSQERRTRRRPSAANRSQPVTNPPPQPASMPQNSTNLPSRGGFGRIKAHVRKTASGGLALVKGGLRKVPTSGKVIAGIGAVGAVGAYATRKKRRGWNAKNQRMLNAYNSGQV